MITHCVLCRKIKATINWTKKHGRNFWERRYIFSYFMDMKFGSSAACLQTKLKHVDTTVCIGVLQKEQYMDSCLHNHTIIKGYSFRLWATIYFCAPKDVNASVLYTFIFFLSLSNFHCLLPTSPIILFLVPSSTKSMFLQSSISLNTNFSP